MGSRKEEERIEKIIRGLMKLPPNRRCINCNSLGPQYVCTTFWTFVCMTCSGIHREFTHRVKSVSMAKFTSQEVEALQNGGNQRAREIYLKGWDPQTQRFPDNSNAEKIRQFIKNAYVDKKYYAPKSSDKPPKHLQNSRSLEEDTRRASSYHSYSQSPPYDFQYEEHRYGKHAPALTRKPGSDRGLFEGKFSSFLSPSRSSDPNLEDGFATEGSNPRMSDYSASSGVDHFRSDTQSPNYQRDMGSPYSQTSMDISTKDLQHYTGKYGATTLHPQRTASAGSFGSFDSLSFKSVSSVGVMEVASESERSVEIHASSLDLFSEMPSNLPAATVDSNSQGKVIPPNEGWATFDSQKVEFAVGNAFNASSVISSSKGNSAGNFDPLPQVPWSPFEEPAADKQPSSVPSLEWPSLTEFSARGGSPTSNKMETQSWNAFEDSTVQLNNQSTQAINEHLETQNPLVVDHHMEFGLSEDFMRELTQNNTMSTASLSSGISSHNIVPVEVFPMPVVAGTYAIDHKPTNPFDLPYDSSLESNDMSHFWDMSSLQAALPDAQMPTSLAGDGLTQSWYNPGPVTTYVPSGPQGALGFMAAQAQSAQIPNVHVQGPVASVGGNPFA